MYTYDRRTAAFPKDHSEAFLSSSKDRDRIAKLFLAYVGETLPAAMTATAKKLATALTKALPECQCSVSEAKVDVLPSSHGIIGVVIMVKSPDKSAKIMRLHLRSDVSINPAEKYYSSPSQVFLPPKLKLGLFDPASSVYPAIEKGLTGLPTAKDATTLLKEFGVEKMLKALGGPFQGKGGKPTLQGVKEFIRGLRTYLDLDEETPEGLNYSTREDGDVGDSRPGAHDIQEAKRIVEALRAEFGSANIHANWQAVDEWVHLTVELR